MIEKNSKHKILFSITPLYCIAFVHLRQNINKYRKCEETVYKTKIKNK